MAVLYQKNRDAFGIKLGTFIDGCKFAPTGATTNPARGANRALRDLNRRLGLGPKTLSWPSPRLRFNPAGFAPPPDTNWAYAHHEQFHSFIGLLLIPQERTILLSCTSIAELVSQERLVLSACTTIDLSSAEQLPVSAYIAVHAHSSENGNG